MHLNAQGQPCDCGFGERLLKRQAPQEEVGVWASLRPSKTDARHYEEKMYHGSQRGILGPVRIPFWTTSHEPEAQGFGGGGEAGTVVHPVSVRFKQPARYFGALPYDWREQAESAGHDGVVVHFPEDYRDPSDPYPQRTWAIALDPGAVVPGHDHEWPY